MFASPDKRSSDSINKITVFRLIIKNMEKKAEKIHADQWLKDLPLSAENPAFSPEEMIVCQKCGRTNPPTRLDCLYCAAALEISEAQNACLKLKLRKLENWEKGFNIIYSPDAAASDEDRANRAARILQCDENFLRQIFAAGKALPLARVESAKEAEIIEKQLTEIGVKTRIVSDENLLVEKLPRRLRRIEFAADKIQLALFNRDEIVEISKNDLALIVTGAIFERKIEATETRAKKSDNKIVQTSETASDEFLIDLYSRDDAVGFRIFANGFDFSCLDAEKEIVAAKNLKTLARKLRENAPNAKFVDDYLENRADLGYVWTIDEKKDSQGVKREGFGKFYLGNVTTINNLLQFTKYSRLQSQIL